MSKIQVLDPITIDKIAAGEVIERPASVVKELVENAIDAGATAIVVEIKEGGISFMRITDNGCGIERDDVRSAFLRHSTSKIRSVDDLVHIGSLGFRGEALSSISAVAQVELITKTSSTVTDVIVWHIEQSGADTFSATYEVDQQIKEGEQTSNVKATYTVKVYVDADGDMVIVQNPTLAPAVEKSDYEPKTLETDASVDADTVNDATAFLETFFKLYPTATEKELAYHVSGNVLEPIGRDYLYSELVNPVFTKDGDNVKVKVAVKFLDNQTKATLVSQYELVLHKDSNWKIV